MKTRLVSLFGFLALWLSASAASAFDRSIWDETTRPTGTTFFFCKSPACGTGAIDSYHPQPASLYTALRAFAEHTAWASKVEAEQLGNRVNVISMKELSKRGMREYRSERILTNKDGKTDYYIDGFIAIGDQAFTLVASASDNAQAHKNYDLLLQYVHGLFRSI